MRILDVQQAYDPEEKNGKLQQDQDTNRARIGQLEAQVGNILEKLKEYE